MKEMTVHDAPMHFAVCLATRLVLLLHDCAERDCPSMHPNTYRGSGACVWVLSSLAAAPAARDHCPPAAATTATTAVATAAAVQRSYVHDVTALPFRADDLVMMTYATGGVRELLRVAGARRETVVGRGARSVRCAAAGSPVPRRGPRGCRRLPQGLGDPTRR